MGPISMKTLRRESNPRSSFRRKSAIRFGGGWKGGRGERDQVEVGVRGSPFYTDGRQQT